MFDPVPDAMMGVVPWSGVTGNAGGVSTIFSLEEPGFTVTRYLGMIAPGR